MAGVKTYTGEILLGKTTPSYDLESEYDQEFPFEHITKELIEEVRQSFIGPQLQTPPIFSAKKVDGKRAYDLARANKEVKLEANPIEIFELKIDMADFPEIAFEVSCTKGTYIRSLAHDFGKSLKSGGTLIELRRTKSGEQRIEDSKTVDAWLDFIENSPL